MVVTNPQHENRSNRTTTSYPGESIRPTRNGWVIFNRAKARRRRSLMKIVIKNQSQYSMACSVQKLAARFFLSISCAFKLRKEISLSIGRPHMFPQSCRNQAPTQQCLESSISVASSFALKAVVSQPQKHRWPNILFFPRNAPIRHLTPEPCQTKRRLSPLVSRTICRDAVVRQGRDAAKRPLKKM